MFTSWLQRIMLQCTRECLQLFRILIPVLHEKYPEAGLLGGTVIPCTFWRDLLTVFVLHSHQQWTAKVPISMSSLSSLLTLLPPPPSLPWSTALPPCQGNPTLSMHTAFSSSQPPLLPGSYSSQYPPCFFLMQHSAGLCHLTHAYFVHGSMLSALHGSISFNLRIIPLMARHLQSPFYGEMSLSEM